jgi:CRP/FNR family transcriptional regulator, cyclic AMP receptor protein
MNVFTVCNSRRICETAPTPNEVTGRRTHRRWRGPRGWRSLATGSPPANQGTSPLRQINEPMPDTIELLRNVPIFRDLDDAELEEVAAICHEEKFTSGTYIFREGELGNRLYLILEGEVRISRVVPGSGEEALAVLKTGSLFGEMAVFDRGERSTDAISNGGTTCLTIARPDFEMLLDFNREISYKVLWGAVRLLSMRLRATNDSLRSFLAMSMF